jgi:protein transport protein SEC31
LDKLSREFEATMDPNNVIAFCHNKASAAHDDMNDKRLWKFMQVIFETNARQQLLDTLGYDPSSIAAKASEYHEEANGKGHGNGEMPHATQNVVKEALIVGNFEAAVDCCFRTGNLADALVLASCGGAELWAKTQERYFESQAQRKPFLSVVGAIIQNDLGPLVQKSDLANWQETLAILSTYGKSDEFPTLCIALGDKLDAAGDHSDASLCYMCALSLNKAVKHWRMKLKKQSSSEGGSINLNALHDFVVKVSIFLQAAGFSESLTSEDEELFSSYAEKLAGQGLLVTAAKYCKGESISSKILRDRLYRSRASQKCLEAMGGKAPEFPFSLADVKQKQESSRNHYRNKSNRSYGSNNGANSVSHAPVGNTGYTQQAPAAAVPAALPEGWIALQDPSSGRSYYANQTTGEVSWDKPQAAPVPGNTSTPVVAQPSPQVRSKPSSSSSRNAKMASKYGDGFVSSASNPELASQYGNVGTSNPYHTTDRPGTATVSSAVVDKPPVSGNVDTIPPLKAEYQTIPDTLLALIEALKGGQLSSVDKRQLVEAKKAVAIFSKRLALGTISDEIAKQMLSMTNFLAAYEWSSATASQTSLVSNEWKEHREWLKGIKALVQLATKMYSR